MRKDKKDRPFPKLSRFWSLGMVVLVGWLVGLVGLSDARVLIGRGVGMETWHEEDERDMPCYAVSQLRQAANGTQRSARTLTRSLTRSSAPRRLARPHFFSSHCSSCVHWPASLFLFFAYVDQSQLAFSSTAQFVSSYSSYYYCSSSSTHHLRRSSALALLFSFSFPFALFFIPFYYLLPSLFYEDTAA